MEIWTTSELVQLSRSELLKLFQSISDQLAAFPEELTRTLRDAQKSGKHPRGAEPADLLATALRAKAANSVMAFVFRTISRDSKLTCPGGSSIKFAFAFPNMYKRHSRGSAMLLSRTALILNFTGNIYHWGCFGTACEVYQTLLERGYAPSFLSVVGTHSFRPAPENLDQLRSPAFTAQILQANPFLQASLAETDLVVINGEGTLHRMGHEAPRNLLFLMYLAREHFGKPVHLINHSFYPTLYKKR